MAPENAKIFQMLQAGVILNAELLCEVVFTVRIKIKSSL
jgi:hypothetical protein